VQPTSSVRKRLLLTSGRKSERSRKRWSRASPSRISELYGKRRGPGSRRFLLPGRLRTAIKAWNGPASESVDFPMPLKPTSSETGPLVGYKILIVEDEAPIALNLATAVQQAGGTVIGPAATVAAAHAIMADNRLDGALLDIRLRDETSFSLADVLAVLNIPFVFVSGVSSALMPLAHRERPLFDKPYETAAVIEALARLVRGAAPAASSASGAPASTHRKP